MAQKPFLDVSKFDTELEHSSRKDDCLVNCPSLHQGGGPVGKAEIHPTEVTFGDTVVNANSAPHTVTVTNTGEGVLSINDILVVGDFTGSTAALFPILLNKGESVEVLAFFRPRDIGARTGGMYFDTGDAQGMEFVEFFGSGLVDDDDGGVTPPDPEPGVVSLSPTSLAFGALDVGSTSAAKNITLKNDTDAKITIGSIATTGDYTQSNNCGSSLSAGSSCVIAVRFKPTVMGARSGSLAVAYGTTSKTAALSGQGTDPSSVLPTISISDGTIVSGESSVALRAYPDGATELTSITLPSTIEGTASFFDLEIKALGTGSVELSELPATAQDMTVQYGTTHGDWSAMTTATLESGDVLYCRVTAPATLTVGTASAVISFKVNGLAKAFTATKVTTESPEITKRVRIAGNQFYLATSTSDTGGTLPSSGAFRLKSVNWFGNESANYTFHGVWARRWSDMIDQMAGMGFNTIRIPFCGEIIQNNTTPPASAYDEELNPDFVGKTSLEILDMVIDYCATKGLYVVLDHHRGKAGTGTIGSPIDGDYTLAKWHDTWARMAARYKSKANVVGADVHNEPHNHGWNEWSTMVQNCAAVIHGVTPDWVIFCQGVAEYNGVSYWWGGQLAGVKDKPVVLGVSNRLCYSPHEYGQSVGSQAWLKSDSNPNVVNWPNNLAAIWDAAWGFLYYDQIAPVWVGEFGGHFGVDGSGNITKPNSEVERQWLAQLVKYLNFDKNLDGSISNTEKPNSNWQGISFAYWCYNPNSADTGGLVQDDWTTPQTVKLNLISNLFL